MAQEPSEALARKPPQEKTLLRLLGEVMALAGIYLVTARLGLLVAYPGTNATAVWLPTGIAMAAVLRWGLRVWPGIFLGSLGVNMWLLLGLGISAPASLAAALVTACGSSAEAIVAGFLIEWSTGTRNPFGRSRDVVYFIAFGALLSTVLSALPGALALCMATGKWELLGATSLTWWLGDATGALVVTPLVIALGQRAANDGAFRERMQFLLTASVTTGLWYVGFFRIPALMVLFIPWIAIVALRLSPFFSSAIVLLIAGLATWGTLAGALLLAEETLYPSLLIQEAFIGCIAIASLVLTSTVCELKGNRLLRSETNRFHRDLFERSTMGLALCTMEGRLVEVNPAYAGLLGRTVEETLSLTYWDITPKDYAEQELAQLASLRETGRYGPYEKEYLRKDGSRFPVRLSGLLVKREGETLIWSSAEDITEHQRARTLLRDQKAILEMIAQGRGLEETLEALALRAEALRPGMHSSILLLDPDGLHLRHGAAPSLPKAYVAAIDGGAIGPQAGSCGTAAYRREQVIVTDIAKDPLWTDYKSLALSFGLRACWSTPIFADTGEVLGTFAMYYGEPAAPTEWDLQLIDAGTSLASLAIGQKKAEKALVESEALYRDLVETSQDLIWQCDADARYTYLNPAWKDVFGYKAEEMLGRPFTDFQTPENAARDRQEFSRLMRGNLVKGLESVHQHKDGREIHLVFSAKFLRDPSGRISGTRGTAYDVTRRKLAEEALSESEKRLRNVLDGLGPQMFAGLLDPQGTVLLANRPALEAAALRSEEVLGKPVESTYWWTWSEAVSRRLRAAVDRAAQGEPVRYDERIRVAEGQLIWLDFSIQPLRDETGRIRFLVPSGLVITERKQAEEDLRLRAAQLSALNSLGARLSTNLDLAVNARAAVEEIVSAASPDLALLFLRQGETLRLLGSARGEGGLSHEETPVHCVGQCLCGLAVKEGRALYSKDIRADARCTWEECKKAGVRSFAALPLLAGDKIIGILGLASATERDFQAQSVFLETLAAQVATGIQNARLHEQIERHAADLESRVEERTAQLAEANHLLQAQMAERRKTHAEIERLNEDLRRRAKELQVANRHLQNALDKSESAERVKSAFLAAMSHELRTPLNSVIGFTGVLLGGLAGAVSQEQREALEIVRRNGEHLLALINDVLDLSKIEAGQMRLALRPFELASVVRESVEALRPMADAKGLSLALEPGEETLALQGDRRRVAQILMNLLSNAVKFTQSGGIRVAVSRDEPRQEACVAVTDTGPGIHESDLERIFGEFEQLDSGTARVQEGTGLGLSLSRKLARMMGGDIRAESKRGAGSTFRCILPLRETLDGREADSRG